MDDLFLFLLFQERIKWSLFMIYYSHSWNEKGGYGLWMWSGLVRSSNGVWMGTCGPRLYGLASDPASHRLDFSATHPSPGVKVATCHFIPDTPVYRKTTESCSNFQRFRIWEQQPKNLCACFRFVHHSYVRYHTLLGCRSPSIIRKCIFSFSNLWLLFPFTDGVTNYFIIGFLKTSYLLFGSISKTLTWLSLILMVGLPREEPNGGS